MSEEPETAITLHAPAGSGLLSGATTPDKQPATQRKHSVSSRELTQADIAWTKSVTAQFVGLVQQKRKENIWKRYKEP